jgi:2-C-methyl-D-erythritol 2,4-cyclodiphosphate synthase
MFDIRVGTGFDVHELVLNRPLIIGGLKIQFEKGLLGHSDADVLLHALTDALLGALALGDIGSWFPDNDISFKDIDSKILLKKVWDHIKSLGWKINNLDCTIIAQLPKFRPYVEEIRKNISEILDLEISRISIKATTTEKLGYLGRGEGIAAESVVLLTREF